MSRTTPFSIRFTEVERARLLEKAAGRPLGTFIKELVLDTPVRARRRGPVLNGLPLGRVLGMLGKSRLANNLNQLAKAAHLGALPVTEEVEAELHQACSDIRIMRRLLMQALGILAQDEHGSLSETFNRAAGGPEQ